LEFAEVLKAYLEVGLLGLCAITLIALFYKNFIQSQKKDLEQTKLNDKRLDDLLDMIKNQNESYHKQLIEQFNIMVNKVINGVVNHTMTPEENTKITQITEKIDSNLQNMLIETGASRASLIQFHNGGRGINKQGFLKMSMTNEQVQLGVRPIMSEFKDQFRSVLGYAMKEMNENGYCYIQDCEDIQNLDVSMYEFLKDRGVQSYYCYSIKNQDNLIIGFLCLEYLDRDKSNLDLIIKTFNDNHTVMETLLSL
jgi:hypothetical protein